MLSQSPLHRLPRLASVTAVLFALAAPAAGATVTQTNITSPANHAVIVNNEVTGEPQLTVTGTAPGASDGETVNIICTEQNPKELVVHTLNPSPVIISNHGFSYTGSFAPIKENTCVLRAVPTGGTPADLTPFTGPQIAIDDIEAGNIGSAEDEAIVGGPNSGALFDYYFYGSQFQGAGEYLSISSCGLCDSYAINPTTSTIGSSLFFANAALFSNNDANTRSEIQIDGNNAFASYAAKELIKRTNPTTYNGSEDYSNFPSLSVNTTINPLTGDVSIEEAGSFSHCVGGNPIGSTATHANCSSFAPTGVGYTRHIVQNEDGALVTIYDTFTSTDGAPHQLDLLYYQWVDPDGSGTPGYSFPWLSSAFETPAAYASIAPPAGPASILVKEKAGQADGDETLDQGAITMSAPPSGIEFGKEHTEFELHYTRTIPAGGSVSIGQSFATAFALANVEALARQAKSDFSPTVAISSPTAGSTTTSSSVTVSGTVGAGANGLPGTVSVNGVSAAVSARRRVVRAGATHRGGQHDHGHHHRPVRPAGQRAGRRHLRPPAAAATPGPPHQGLGGARREQLQRQGRAAAHRLQGRRRHLHRTRQRDRPGEDRAQEPPPLRAALQDQVQDRAADGRRGQLLDPRRADARHSS